MAMAYEQWEIILGIVDQEVNLSRDNVIEKIKKLLKTVTILEGAEISRMLEEVSHELETSIKISRVQETRESLKKRLKVLHRPQALEESKKMLQEQGVSNAQKTLKRVLERLGVQETSGESKVVALEDVLNARKISEKVPVILDIKNMLETLEVLKRASGNVYREWEENNFDVNHWFKVDCLYGQCPYMLLYLAIDFRLSNVFNALLKVKGININTQGPFFQWTPLRFAAEDENEKSVSWLINKGANVNQPDSAEQTPLYSGAINGNMEIIKLLVNKGADVNKEDIEKSNPLYKATKNGHIEAAKYLMSHRAIVKASEKHKKTPLHAAIINQDLAMTKTIIHSDENIDNDIDMVDINGRSALYYITKEGNMSLLKLLLKNDADVNLEDVTGKTPLQTAAKNGFVKMARFLIYHNADINYRDANGWTAFDYSAAKNNKIADLLIEHGSNIETRDIQKILSFIYSNNYLEAMNGVIEFGISKYLMGLAGAYALHYAAKCSNVQDVYCLIKSGVNVNVSNDSGLTALHYAAMYGCVKIIEVLYSCNAGMNPQDRSGLTPLHYAAKHGHEETVKTLLSCRASIWVCDVCGERAVDLAKNDNIKQLLEETEKEEVANSLIYTQLEPSTKLHKGTIDATSLAKSIAHMQLKSNEVKLLAHNLSRMQLESNTELCEGRVTPLTANMQLGPSAEACSAEMDGGVKEQRADSKKRKLHTESDDSNSSIETDECNNRWSYWKGVEVGTVQKYSSLNR